MSACQLAGFTARGLFPVIARSVSDKAISFFEAMSACQLAGLLACQLVSLTAP